MKEDSINIFLIHNSGCFDAIQLSSIKSKLETLSDSNVGILMSVRFIDPTIMLIVSIFLGWERFFLDDIAMGILKLITCNGFGIWWLIDIFTVIDRTKKYNYDKFNKITMLMS